MLSETSPELELFKLRVDLEIRKCEKYLRQFKVNEKTRNTINDYVKILLKTNQTLEK